MFIYLAKAEKLAFYILLFTLPFTIRKIIFSWGNFFNEYQTAFIYASDILIIGILICWFLRYFIQNFQFSIFPPAPRLRRAGNFHPPKENKFPAEQAKLQLKINRISNFIFRIYKKFSTFYFLLSTFLLWCLISLLWADNPGIGFYKWLKLLEFSLLFVYLKYNFKNYSFKNIAWTIASSGFFQSVLVFFQFANQKSAGFFRLGEAHFGWGIPGTATFRLFGAKIVRASGTLPHANLLAAFVLFSLFFIFLLYLNRSFPKKISGFVKYIIAELALPIAIYFSILAIILSFSRSAILLAIIFIPLLILYLIFHKSLRQNYWRQIIKLTVILATICSLLLLIFFPFISTRANISLQEAALSDRLTYNQMAWDIIKQHPATGIGLGNYIWFLNKNNLWPKYGFIYHYLFQPVHNIYLLIAAEIGIIGLILFLLFIFFALKNSLPIFKNNLFSIFYFLLLIFLGWGFSDHFLWTINQGQLMWWLTIGILASRPSGRAEISS